MPLWGASRPVTILWLALEDDFERQLVTSEEKHPAIVEAIHKNSLRRGIPVIMPLMDLEDELVVSISDVWGRFPTPIIEASKRYSADSIVFGRINKQAQIWVGRFSFINQNKEMRFEIESDDKTSLIQKLTNQLADKLCEQYCVVEETGQKNEILIDIADVGNFNDFKSLESYLNKMSSIRSIRLVSIVGDRVLFQLTLLGQMDSVTEGISLSQRLIPVEAIEPESAKDDFSLYTDSTIKHSSENTTIIPEEIEPQTNQLSPEQLEAEKAEGGTVVDQLPIQIPLKTLYYRWIG
ncbi:MAG: DUF2066 domain-containing protein [Enterobacterales bacterium]|nr:DUF2066 domain-containing protein [Enterobacterales bacterium]